MDDIIAATGISSGAVYRYFRGKDDLVDAAAEESLALIRDVFARLLTQEPTPTIASGHLAPDANPEHVATVLLTLMPGLIVTRHLVGAVSAHELTEGLSMLGTAATTR
jgi:AcrR family transcriptional regulator